MSKKIYYKWEEFDKDVELLIDQIYNDTYKPDYILGIARGGVTLATKLSYKLDKEVYYFRDGEDLEIIHDMMGLYLNVLIVDDINDTGKTINSVRESLNLIRKTSYGEGYKIPSDLSNIRFLTLFNNKSSSTTVDYSIREIDKSIDDSWIVFPWEK